MRTGRIGIVVCFFIISFWSVWFNGSFGSAANEIECIYSSKGVLTIKGTGTVKFSDIRKSTDDEVGYGVKKIIVKEGIKGIEEKCFYSAFEEVISVELPNTLTYLGNGAFEGCENLKKVRLSENIVQIPDRCFAYCVNLSNVKIPNCVQRIGKNAFLKCERLEELVLPRNMSVWKMPIKGCAMLKKIKNNSTVDCELDDCHGNKTWHVNKKEVKKIAAGTVAIASGKKYKIQYDLLGGKALKKLPTAYEYGSNMKLSDHVSKKGYSFLGWFNWKENQPYYRTDVSPALAKNVILTPFWAKYKVQSIRGGKIKVTLDQRDAVVRFGSFYVRYSTNRNMKNAKVIYTQKAMGNSKVIKGLKKDRYYYIQIACTEGDDDFDNDNIWLGKRKVYVD